MAQVINNDINSFKNIAIVFHSDNLLMNRNYFVSDIAHYNEDFFSTSFGVTRGNHSVSVFCFHDMRFHLQHLHKYHKIIFVGCSACSASFYRRRGWAKIAKFAVNASLESLLIPADKIAEFYVEYFNSFNNDIYTQKSNIVYCQKNSKKLAQIAKVLKSSKVKVLVVSSYFKYLWLKICGYKVVNINNLTKNNACRQLWFKKLLRSAIS